MKKVSRLLFGGLLALAFALVLAAMSVVLYVIFGFTLSA